MAVLEQTSPTAWPSAPDPTPSSTVPSASTSTAVALGSVQLARAGCGSVIAGPNLLGLEGRPGAVFDRGHSRVARQDQRGGEGRDEGAGEAETLDAAPRQCGDQERRHRSADGAEAGADRRRPARAAGEDDQAAPGLDCALRAGWPQGARRP